MYALRLANLNPTAQVGQHRAAASALLVVRRLPCILILKAVANQPWLP